MLRNQKMSPTQKSDSSLLSDNSIRDNAFLMISSSYSPSNSCFLELNSIPKLDSASNMQNVKSSLMALKITESSLDNVKYDLQVSCDGVTSDCKTPFQPGTFNLSNLSSANSSTANSTVDVFCDTKSSTPCKEKLSKLAENVLLKSSEMNDLSFFKKPPPVWEISGIQGPVFKTLPLEASWEELGSLAAVKPDTPSLEGSYAGTTLASSDVTATKHLIFPL